MKAYLILTLMFVVLMVLGGTTGGGGGGGGCCSGGCGRREGFLPEGGVGSSYKFGGELYGNDTVPNLGNPPRIQGAFHSASVEGWPGVQFNPAAAISVAGRGPITGIPNAWTGSSSHY